MPNLVAISVNNDSQATQPHPAGPGDPVPPPSRVGKRLLRHCRQHPRKLLCLLCVLLLGVGFGLWSLPEKVENHGTGGFDIGLTQLLGDWGVLTVVDSLRNHAVTAWESTLGPEHPRSLARMQRQADVMMGRGDWAGAALLFHYVVEAKERSLGPGHPDTLKDLRNLGFMLGWRNDFSGAVLVFRRVVEGQERTLGPTHPDTLWSLTELAAMLSQAGNEEEAESLMGRAIRGFAATTDSDRTIPRVIENYLYNIGGQRAEKTPGK